MGIIDNFYSDFSDENVVCYMSDYTFEKYVLREGIIGREDGLFVIPEKYAKIIEKEAEAEDVMDFRKNLAKKLGLYEDEFINGAVKITIPTKYIKNLHIPCGLESGCNNKWVQGGKTITGIREGIIDQITKENNPDLYNNIIKNVVKI